jgi:aminopeptidase S
MPKVFRCLRILSIAVGAIAVFGMPGSLGVSNLLAQETTATTSPITSLEETIKSRIDKLCKAGQAERQALLSEILDSAGITHRLESFTRGSATGKNIVVDVQDEPQTGTDENKTPWIVLGAHMDRVQLGQGAVDNGGGCVALMTLIEKLKKQPLKNAKVTALFFDLEERGLLGSAAYVETLKEKPTLFINMDVFAYGDQVWLYSPIADHPFVKAAEKVDANHPLTFEFAEAYPPSDHLSFKGAGHPAVSFSLLPPAEVQELEKMFGGDRTIKPKILQLIHTADDLPTKVQPAAMASGIDFMDQTLRLWYSEQMPN